MTDADDIDWKEAFCWFFWDICDRDEDESYEPGIYNDFVSGVISRERRPINTIDHPRSWNHLLWHLMRRRGPFVNWMDFNDREWDMGSFEMEPEPNSSWVMGYLESRAYGRSSIQPGLGMTMAEAWSRNPHLANFQATYNLPLPWAVPLQKRPEDNTYEILSTWPFKIVFDSSLGIAHLISNGNGNLHRNAVNEARYYFTGMLRWSREVRVSGRVCSIRPYMQGGANALDLAAGQQVALSRALWHALKELRDLGDETLAPKPLASVDSKNLVLPSTARAKRDAPAIDMYSKISKKHRKLSYLSEVDEDSE
ncbi:hypothetical protein CKAH01_18320 [Colletotrichum kahawae]|uniref:Uncharacterized protein n=1 Tax=Colletotrichum kahawae TaxID=34407 RepID=A0AAD9Y932_COLKA|nr:hypothetical protein CKAH01_18320 [Colletotrichum kahawae]